MCVIIIIINIMCGNINDNEILMKILMYYY